MLRKKKVQLHIFSRASRNAILLADRNRARASEDSDEDSDEEEEEGDDGDDERSVQSDEEWPEDEDELDGDAKMPAVPANDSVVIRDNKLKLRLVCRLTDSRPGDLNSLNEAIGRSLRYLTHGRTGKRLGCKAICARFRVFVKSGLIRGETLRLFIVAYRADKLNKGNTTCHHSAKASTIRNTDDKVASVVESGVWFLTQGTGSAETMTNANGSRFDPDLMDGQDIVFVHVVYKRGKKGEGRAVKSRTTYRRKFWKTDLLTGIGFRGLTERFREGRGGGGGTQKGRVKARKFMDYELEVDKTVCIANPSNGTIEEGHHNNFFVVRARVVKKKKKGGEKKK